jgi:hypothetical protein
MYEGTRKNLTTANGGVRVASNKTEDSPLEKPKEAYSEIDDIFPALKKYKDEHTTANLQKLCAEVAEFCRSIYASTRNDAERSIYRATIEKLNK